MIPDWAIRIAKKLYPEQEIVYCAEYQDGCKNIVCDKGATIWEGKKHSPHSNFEPDDKPINEWRK